MLTEICIPQPYMLFMLHLIYPLYMFLNTGHGYIHLFLIQEHDNTKKGVWPKGQGSSKWCPIVL